VWCGCQPRNRSLLLRSSGTSAYIRTEAVEVISQMILSDTNSLLCIAFRERTMTEYLIKLATG